VAVDRRNRVRQSERGLRRECTWKAERYNTKMFAALRLRRYTRAGSPVPNHACLLLHALAKLPHHDKIYTGVVAMFIARKSAAIALAGISALWAGHTLGAITPISNVAITGTYDVWALNQPGTSPGQLLNIGDGTPPLADYLAGDAAAPGDNIELGNDRTYAQWAAGQRTTLTGDVGGGLSVALVTPTLGDWSANGLALAYHYVIAALDSIEKTPADWNPNVGGGLPVISFDNAVNQFVFGNGTTTSGAFAISDPNASYVYSDVTAGGQPIVYVGLAGNYDAEAVVGPLLPYVGYDPDGGDPFPPQASEVVRLDLLGPDGIIKSKFRYTFTATRTGQAAADCNPPTDTCSYTGNYEVNLVPVPAPGVLFSLGLVGLLAVRRRAAPR
jgi:hypothetical protein